MAFPQTVAATETAFPTQTTAHLVNLPATVDADDLLLVIIGFEAPGAVTTPTGWTLLFFHSHTVAQNDFFCYVRKADGTEDGGTVDIVSTNSRTAAAHAFRITDWFEDLAGVEGSGAHNEGTNAAPDPPDNTPSWGAEDTLWIAVNGAEDDDVTHNGFPTNYENTGEIVAGGIAGQGYEVASATRELNATSENPTAFSLASTENWLCDTIAVRPLSIQAALILRRREEGL